MKKFISVLLSLILLFSCAVTGASCAEGKKISVVTTTFPIYDWVREIVKDEAEHVSLTLLREADQSVLNYRVLKESDKGEDVLALKKRLQELGYIRSGSDLTNVYNDVTAERVMLFQRQLGITEDGIASQELQAYLFSEKAPECGQKLPKIRSRVASQDGSKRVICGCCMGEGCECCGFKGWIDY